MSHRNIGGSYQSTGRGRSERIAAILTLILGSILIMMPPAHAQVAVLTSRNDNARTGQNLNETLLTPSNVNSSSFGFLLFYPVDGDIYTQPLYVPNLNIAGGVHNTIFVTTNNASVYAFDADSNAGSDTAPLAPLWHVSFVNPAAGVTAIPVPNTGIPSTPVIDLSSNTLYVIARTQEVNSSGTSYVLQLHALDLSTGVEKFGGPVVAQAQINGDGYDSLNGIIAFNPTRQISRPALLLANGVVYAAFGSIEDRNPFHGWVLGYDAQTLQLVAAFNDTPNSGLAGIWQSGGGLAADELGNLYCVTGNGGFDTHLDANGFPLKQNYGDSFLKLGVDPLSSPMNQNGNGYGLLVTDYFTPTKEAILAAHDLDEGSGGPVLLPDAAGSATHPHLMAGWGKTGWLYLLDRDSMGQFSATANQIVQQIPNAHSGFSTPAYFNNTLYCVAVNDVLKAYSIANAQLSSAPVSQGSAVFGYPGASPSISANGSENGIVWALEQHGYVDGSPAVLYAYDASNVANQLYDSTQAGIRDQLGGAVHFTSPTIINGKVYVGTSKRLNVLGLLPPYACTVTSLAPSLVWAPSSGFTLTVNGSNFQSGAVVQWITGSGKVVALPTNFVSQTQLTASVPSTVLKIGYNGRVSVSQDGLGSSPVPFVMISAFNKVTPNVVNAGGPDLMLTLNGINFQSGAVVNWTQNGTTTALATSFVSHLRLTATVPSALIASAGKATLSVSMGGLSSPSLPFTIHLTTLQQLTPAISKDASGNYQATITLQNMGYLTASNVMITKSSLGAAGTSTSLPVSLGDIAAGATGTATLTYPASAGSSGSVVMLKYYGTYTGNTFSGSTKVTLP